MVQYQIEDGQAYILCNKHEFLTYQSLSSDEQQEYFDKLMSDRPIYSLIED
ncbi:hypothetical protein ACLIM5_003364 [Vibrio cholerae]